MTSHITSLTFSDGFMMKIPSLWLRDCCMCSQCKVVVTSEKKFQCCNVDVNIAPESCVVDSDDAVKIVWPGGHVSEYQGQALRAFADKPNGEGLGTLMCPPAVVEACVWPEDFQPLRITMNDLLHQPTHTIIALTELLRHGVFIITDASSVPNTLERLAPVFGPMHEVLFERVHNVKLDPNKIIQPAVSDASDVGDVEGEPVQCYNIAHTGLAVPPHNDFASYTWNPSVQCLHMLVNEADGGRSCVVDGWATLKFLQKNYPEYFDILRRFKVPFREFDEHNETYTEEPIIRCDINSDEIIALRYSNQLMQAINPLHPEAALFYRAYHMLSSLLMNGTIAPASDTSVANNGNDNGNGNTDPKISFSADATTTLNDRRAFRAHSGNIIVVAGHRVLHAREHIQPTGHRHLQDAYFCHDNLRNKRQQLIRQQAQIASSFASTTTATATTNSSHTISDISSNNNTSGICTARSLREFSKKEFDDMTAKYNAVCSAEHLANRSIAMLQAQNTNETILGCNISLYTHGLQTATRAYRAGADEETIVCALLHDVGELISPSSHGDIISSILMPYISLKNQWVLRMHEIFQGYHYFDHIVGANKYKRDEWKTHEFYQDCVTFCDDWDQASFDSEYETIPLDFFRPMVIRIFSKTAYWWDINHPKSVAVLGGVGKEMLDGE